MSSTKAPSIRVPLIVFTGTRSVPAELWKREGTHATLWCREPLDRGLRCDVMLEGISAGVPVLVRVEVNERSDEIENQGVKGYLHLVELAFLRRSDQRKLDVWMRAAETARRDKNRAASAARRGRKASPAAPEHDLPSTRQRSRPKPHSPPVFPAGPRQVLLVEGGRSHADELAEALDPSGRDFVVESIWTLSELRGRLTGGRVHLVLLDPDLPDSRGLATVQEAVAHARGVPVVVLRGASEPGFEVKCLLAGAARVLRKDAIGLELARRVLALLGVPTRPRRRERPPLPDANPTVRPVAQRQSPAPERDRTPRRHPGPVAEVKPIAPLPAPEPPAPEPEPPAPEPRAPLPAPEPPAPEPAPEPPPPSPAPEPPALEPPAPVPPDPAPEPPAPTPPPPEEPESMAAELWWHEDGFAAIWCSEALRIGLRCEMLLDPEERGRPELFRVEIVRAHHKAAADGRNGYLHEATMHRAPDEILTDQHLRPPSARPARPRPEPRAAQGSPFRVVLVEHNPSFGPSALRAELGRMEGVLIETRSSLAGLRARLRRDGVQLVLIELDLPDSQGPDTARAALGYAAGTPVVALSAEPTPELAAACLELGVACLLGKDADRETLRGVVEGVRG
jgi:DNA-binding response OmpR family regulator